MKTPTNTDEPDSLAIYLYEMLIHDEGHLVVAEQEVQKCQAEYDETLKRAALIRRIIDMVKEL